MAPLSGGRRRSKKKLRSRSFGTPSSFTVKRERKAAMKAASTPATTASTDDSDNDNSSLDSTIMTPTTKRRKLQAKSTPGSNNSNKLGSRTSASEIIDLLSDDDDEAPAAFPSANSGNQRSSSPMMIDLSMSTSQDEEDKKLAAKPQNGTVKVKNEPTQRSNNGIIAGGIDDDDDELAVVDRAEFEEELQATETSGAANADGDGIELMGTRGSLRLPHAREHCLEKPFARKTSVFSVATTAQRTANKAHCDMCYCWVCDCPVAECENWNDHCMATDKEQKWIQMRLRHREKKQREEQGEASMEEDESESSDATPTMGSYALGFNSLFSAAGSQKCRHCGIQARRSAADGRRDWCVRCGRVALSTSLAKPESWPYEAPPPKNEEEFNRKSYELGEKSIDFRIHAHDPREMSEFSGHWEENDWTYESKDAKEEFFLHRLGSRPSLHTVLHSIAIVSEDKIPTDFGTTVCASETDAIVLSDPKDAGILVSLKKMSPAFGTKQGRYDTVCGDIRATYDKESQTGTIILDVKLRAKRTNKRFELSEFLGNWYGIFPFAIEDFAGREKARYKTLQDYEIKYCSVDVPPFKAQVSDVGVLETGRKNKVRNFNKSVKSVQSQLALNSSDRSSLGGTCYASEGGLSGVFKRMLRESLDDILDPFSHSQGFGMCLGQSKGGQQLFYRNMRQPGGPTLKQSSLSFEERPFTTVLPFDDFASLAVDPPRDSKSSITSIDKTMVFLENLGHEAAPAVEGINVELLPFQLQSLKWALERETTPGGIETFFWQRLPNTNLYFNPIIGVFKENIKLVRGGIIAEQMGLGKTVISLALILKNPAPELPLSSSKASEIPTNPDRSKSFWDPDLTPDNQREKGENETTTSLLHALGEKKRGSVISQGTLVVCTVSLVGQWIEEAKSKLSDPGLVYPYHGQSRKRDPKLLSKQSIVVTSYETLVSDMNYWAKKSGPSYCPPLEKIRWWRVICDESHCLRAVSNKSIAVMRLMADNKWLVTGTPVNTSLADLKEQTRFLGISNVPDYFLSFSKHVYSQVNDPKAKKASRRNYMETSHRFLGHFAGFFRSIMMRHSQTQTYKGTSTTLMSLPPKTERTVKVSFNAADKKEYSRLAASVLVDYTQFRSRFRNKMSSHYLQLMSKLNPLRVACAGGPIPLTNNTPPEDSDNEDEDPEENAKAKDPVQYSDYVYRSKIDQLVKELKSIRDNDEDSESDKPSKCLVFTQFSSTLKALQKELPVHGFQFRLLAGSMTMKQRAKALSSFQNDPPTTIFLLNTRAAACGINLTQANKVFLMEPVMNPAVHAQAIGRVFRLGQTRAVEIIRMEMEGENNVETKMVELLKKKFGSVNGEASSTEDAAKENGNDSDSDDDDSDHDDDGDKKMPAKKGKKRQSHGGSPVANSRVGSITSDRSKVQMVTEEFDTLFGFEGGADEPPAAAAPASYDSDDSLEDYYNFASVKNEPSSSSRWML